MGLALCILAHSPSIWVALSPMSVTRALVFPGQGSQTPGMGRAIRDAHATAAETWEEADDALSFALSRLAFEGPPEELTRTEHAQPALLTHSMAIMRVLERDAGLSLPRLGAYVAGHSLGEYTALTAAGAFQLADAVRLVRRRGQAMQNAVPVGNGAMAALIGADPAIAAELVTLAAKDDVLAVGNDNAPGQVVVSGAAAAVDRVAAIAPDHGVKRVIRLDVSAPFHCPLMAPAAEVMDGALASLDIQPPAVPVIANVDAEPVTDPAGIRERLVAQVTGCVRWRQSMEWLRDHQIDSLVEVGPGRVLSGLARRIDRSFAVTAISEPDDLDVLMRTV